MARAPTKFTCPTCAVAVPAEAPARPFCSVRCQRVDLWAWLRGHYAIPAEAVGDETPGSGSGPVHEPDALD